MKEKKGKSHNKFCMSCGARLEPGDIFCTNCGTPVPDDVPLFTEESEVQPQKAFFRKEKPASAEAVPPLSPAPAAPAELDKKEAPAAPAELDKKEVPAAPAEQDKKEVPAEGAAEAPAVKPPAPKSEIKPTSAPVKNKKPSPRPKMNSEPGELPAMSPEHRTAPAPGAPKPQNEQEGSKKLVAALIAAAIILFLGLTTAIVIMVASNREPEAVTVPDFSEEELERFESHMSPEPEAAEKTDAPEHAARIDESVAAIREEIASGSLTGLSVEPELFCYSENGSVRAIISQTRSGERLYMREYFYENDALIFAHYQEKSSDSFYFDSDSMFRWIHQPGGSEISSTVEVRDGLDISEYRSTEEKILSDSGLCLSKASAAVASGPSEAAPEQGAQSGDYILPDSDSRYLGRQDLSGLSARECMLARNEIFARRGRKFIDQGLQEYFSSRPWYEGRIEPDSFDSSVFNEFELANIELILNYETEMGYNK